MHLFYLSKDQIANWILTTSNTATHSIHIGANLIPDSVFKPMSKNQNDDNDYLRLFSIVFFAVESDSGVKWSLKLVQGPKKRI